MRGYQNIQVYIDRYCWVISRYSNGSHHGTCDGGADVAAHDDGDALPQCDGAARRHRHHDRGRSGGGLPEMDTLLTVQKQKHILSRHILKVLTEFHKT